MKNNRKFSRITLKPVDDSSCIDMRSLPKSSAIV
jgi:hypothetical protein